MSGYVERPKLTGELRDPNYRKRHRFIFLLPLFMIAPSYLPRIASLLGFKTSYALVLYGTITCGVLCVAGAVISYRIARKQVERDLAEMTAHSQEH